MSDRHAASSSPSKDEPIFAVYDACVLFSPFLRDFLMRLAVHGRRYDVMRAKWTGRIHQEWVRAVLRKRPDLNRTRLLSICRRMDQHVLGCRVVGYLRWEKRLTLPDADDRHVLAAALSCAADVIVTNNIKDFPSHVLAPFGIIAESPDDFVGRLFARRSDFVISAAAEHRASLQRPAMSVAEYLDALRKKSLTNTADVLSTQPI